jgi:hypothetical protein
MLEKLKQDVVTQSAHYASMSIVGWESLFYTGMSEYMSSPKFEI